MAKEKEEAKEVEVKAEVESKPSKRLRWLQSVFGETSGRKRFKEEQAKGKELYA